MSQQQQQQQGEVNIAEDEEEKELPLDHLQCQVLKPTNSQKNGLLIVVAQTI